MKTRSLRWFARFLLSGCAALLVTACGGGGGGNDDDDGFSFLLTEYQYAVTNAAGTPAPFTYTTVTSGLPDDTYSLDAGSGTVRGRFERNTRRVTFDTTTTFSVNWSSGGPAPGQFSAAVTAAGQYNDNSFLPSSGAFAVTWGTESILVTYGSSVEVQLNGGEPVVLSPGAFSVLDGPASVAPDWQQVAARTSRALAELLRGVRSAAGFLEAIDAGEFDSGQRVTPCTAIPGSPPAGVIQAGERVVTRLSSQNYRSVITDCFSQAVTVATVTSATTEFRNLRTTVDSVGAVTAAGFVPTPGIPGGVEFVNSRSRFLAETSPGIWQFNGNEVQVSGGYAVNFTEP